MDTHAYLEINRLARESHWAHSFADGFALYGGIALLALFIVLACLRARSHAYGSPRRLAACLWTGLGALVALGLNQPLSHLLGRARPYVTLHHVEVLVPRVHDFSMPSDHATVAGAVAIGLWLSRDRLLAGLATLVALALGFGRVYVGAHYPSDVLAGLAFGGLVVALGYLAAVGLLERGVRLVARTPLRPFVAAHHDPPPGAGPAAQPTVLEATGAVRLLGDSPLAPKPPGPAAPVRTISGPSEAGSDVAGS